MSEQDLERILAKVNAALAASQAEVERLTRERDEARQDVALKIAGVDLLASERDTAIARERALRACLETVFAQHGDPNGEDPGCMMTRATYERIDDLLHNPANAAPSPACPSCERMMDVRPEVRAFALAMEERLRANDHKGGWKKCEPDWLFERMRCEGTELLAALIRLEKDPWHATAGRVTVDRVVHEAADVANFAMMIADVCGGLRTEIDAALAHAEGK